MKFETAGKMTREFVKGTVWLAIALGCAPGNVSFAAESGGFIFSADRVFNARNTGEFVQLSERLPVAQLKKRFSRYTVHVTKGEDCLVCAAISGSGGGLYVDYDEAAVTVTRISSEEKNSRDAMGNAIGSSLREAVGSAAQCDAGMSLTCASPKLKGLSYIVADDDKCTIVVNEEKKLSEIPACARIDGFEIR